MVAMVSVGGMVGGLIGGVAEAQPRDEKTPFKDHRAVWISRFEFNSQASIQQAMQNIADVGFTDVVFQIRGQGDVLFDSNIETWDPYRYPGGNPGFDPLGVAVQSAHSNGLKIQAWMNTIPMWRDTTSPYSPPSDPNHFYNANPNLRAKDINGNDMPISSGQYVGVNATDPGTVTHLTSLVQEIVQNYDVDGVHLDYIRNVVNGSGTLLYPQDPATRARFTSETGLNPSINTSAYKTWVGGKITTLVESIKSTVESENPNLELSAAVWRDYIIGGNDYQQFANEWVESGAVNNAMPMIYTTNDSLFRQNVLLWKSLNPDSAISFGLGTYLHNDADQTLRQLRMAQYLGGNGFTTFSYNDLYDGGSLSAIGQAVKTFNEELAAREDHNLPISYFEDDEGYFGYSPTLSGSNQGITDATADLSTEAAYTGLQSQKITIDGDANGWFLRHVAGDGVNPVASPSSNQELIADGSIGFWLMTEDEGLSVRVAVDDVEGTAERGIELPIIADGEWHLYEWDLDNDLEWEGWVNGDGLIEGQTVTLDSIQFFGAGDATFYLDKVAFNPFGSLATIPEPASVALMLVGAAGLMRRR